MDLWSVDQTKAAFFGLTAHWIEVGDSDVTGRWILQAQAIAFRGILGVHSGDNLGRYFIGLCERAGIVVGQSSKVCND
jgi:hypothetical protein